MRPEDRDIRGTSLRYIIIGAGMAGILSGIRLKQRGETNFVIYEKGDSVGGTWRENTYPGLTCDTPAHSYTYSFALNPDWSAYFAPGPEIKGYFEAVAKRYGLYEHIVFNAEMARCEWRDNEWHVRTRDGRLDKGQVLVAATGVLHHPQIPDIPGLESFARPWFHSARWDHSVPVDGQRIGVIGSGSTGVQLICALAKRAARLVHFQRSPQWIMPCPDIRYSIEDKRRFREDPARIEEVRNGPEAAARRARFTSAIIDVDSPQLAEIQQIVAKNLDDSIRDPLLREKLRPNYRAACKRLVFSAHFYNAVQQPAVIVENTPIARIEPNGVRMKSGELHELDVLVLATGFKVDRFTRPMKVIGQGGVDLDDLWAARPRAYYAVTVPGFPNLCLLNGPTGPVGNFSLVDIAELQWNYFDQLLDLLRKGECRGFAPSMAALESYEAQREVAAKRTVFASGCRSWYLDDRGIPQVWPWSWQHFVTVMARPEFGDYELIEATGSARSSRVSVDQTGPRT
jgi:cation diffusion facilitator CzcD-associated flavoprotein CzcO